MRTVFLADYFVNDSFRRELLRVLNRGEAVNALKRAIYIGRVVGYQAKREAEMQAVADALSLLANIVMAWNTAQMQAVIDRWNNRRRERIPTELIGRIAPTRIEGINLRGVFRFPIEQFADQILPSASATKIAVGAHWSSSNHAPYRRLNRIAATLDKSLTYTNRRPEARAHARPAYRRKSH